MVIMDGAFLCLKRCVASYMCVASLYAKDTEALTKPIELFMTQRSLAIRTARL